MAGNQVAAGKESRPGVSRRHVLTYGATTVGALAVGGFGGAAVQRRIDDAQVPPTVAPQALLDDAST
ncbi:MAG TPA: hypothetical protein VHN18_06605, partial [Micromonosporaceae bacterium]|nr:hypothetical protein [Micromonosporaceae bacterium]